MPIKLKIDVTKIIKEHLFKGAKGTYLDVVLWPTPDDQYDNDWRVVQDLPREARDAGEKGPILGNGKNFGDQQRQKPPQKKSPPPQRKPPADPDLDGQEENIPF